MNKKQEVKSQKILTQAYTDYKDMLSKRAFFKVNDRVVSEYLVQDTFIKTWKYLMKGGKIEIMGAFLYHVLNNLIVDEYRKHKTTSLDSLLEKGFEPRAEDHERIFDALDGKTSFGLIEHLPRIYKKVIRMKYAQDLSLKEMSQITGKSKNVIAVQTHRGLEKLKLLYNPA
ncbi:MAG: RNA polymerase sigma factor [Patescibacteria group bacterium]|nr:RNA polymerase sigma factor [Patescibacteria group bacterium]